jgi:hypothetical protein
LAPNSPDDTVITCAGEVAAGVATSFGTVGQTAADVRLTGFTIENTGLGTWTTGQAGNDGLVILCNNPSSVYRRMNFIAKAAPDTNTTGGRPVWAIGYDLAGLWQDCTATHYAWNVHLNKSMVGTWERCKCVGMTSCFGGDGLATGTTSWITGTLRDCVAGDLAFGGCAADAIGISSTALLERCTGGGRSFAMGREIAGTLRDCWGDYGSFAGNRNNGNPGGAIGKITGRLERCYVKADGSASVNPFGSGHTAGGIIGGTLIDCDITQLNAPIQLTGAKLHGCRVGAAANVNALTLTDSLSVIHRTAIATSGSGKGV